MKLTAMLLVVVLGFLVSNVNCLKHNYYKHTCPQAEHVVGKMVKDFVAEDIGIAPEIIRLHFHDCFVRGCDGSVLLNSTAGNKAERDAPPNNPSLGGFDEIDEIKEALEKKCPNVVSCADIIAYAARESVFLSGKFPHYAVKGGRRDGRVSRAKEALANLPPPSSNVSSLIQRFALKGLSAKEMVTLSGIHSIGDSFCSSILGRFNNFNNTGKPDPTMNKNLAASLRKKCKNINNKVKLDTITPTKLDNKYYTGLLQHKGLFTSDATLLTNKLTLTEVKTNAAVSSVWEKKFVRAIKKMGEIGVLTGKQGEIRRKCSIVN